MAFSLENIIGGNIGDAFSKIVGAFKVDPTKQMEAQAQLDQIKAELQGKIIDATSNEISQAALTIRSEAQSGDKYTARARPTYLYICNFILLFNYVLCRFLKMTPIDLPPALLWLFGSVMLGYTGARTWEKFMGLPGESEISLPLGISASNKQKEKQ